MNAEQIRKKLKKGEEFLERTVIGTLHGIDNFFPQNPSKKGMKINTKAHTIEKDWSASELKMIARMS
jgi:hypothetical protein